MSRWLKSVNILLEQLDGQVEDAVDESGDVSGQFDDNDYDSDDYDSEYDSEELESSVDVDFEASHQEPLFPEVEPFDESQLASLPQIPAKSEVQDKAAIDSDPVVTVATTPSSPPEKTIFQENLATKIVKEDTQAPIDTESPDVEAPCVEQVVQYPPPPPPRPATIEPLEKTLEAAPRPPTSENTTWSAPMSGMSSIETPPASGVVSLPTNNNQAQQQLKRSNRELKKMQAEARQLRKHVMQLNAQLESTETEMAAQRQELQRAAERMERDRLRRKEEAEDLMDEHEEEMEQQKEHYEKLLEEQKLHFEQVVQDLQDRLSMEEEKRMREGGDWTKELEDSLLREREALKKLGEYKDQNATLQSKLSKLEAQQNALQYKLETSAQNAQTASEREREAEDKLDASLSLHSRQLSQRQAREAELERTIADLSAALTVARQKEQNRAVPPKPGMGSDTGYKKQYELTVDELETVRVQLSLETQRCEALRQELNEISQERTEEASAAHARQQQHDRRVADLTANVARLEATVRELKKSTCSPDTGESSSTEDARVLRLLKEGEELKQSVASLSEQLIQLQEKNEGSKSEVLTLKNRLQAATTRAQNAEQALTSIPAPSTSQMYQVEGGGVSYGSGVRRRIKGGRSSSASVRSIRSALNMNPGRVGEGTEQVASTIDAIDSWVVDTGSFLRHEPLARLAFLLYLLLLHLWAFCLVLFHTHSFEKEHADFGSLTVPGEVGHRGHP